jgi:hypothetical protein
VIEAELVDWHSREHEDEFFLVLDGRLELPPTQERDAPPSTHQYLLFAKRGSLLCVGKRQRGAPATS